MGDGGSARVGSSPGDYGDYYSWHAAHSRRAVDLGEDRVLHVHYERLQDEPEAVARDIYAFLYPTESSPSREKVDEAVHFASFAVTAARRAGKECEIPNFKGSYLGRFPLVLADFWTSDHLLERSRSVDAFSGTRARGTRTLKRR